MSGRPTLSGEELKSLIPQREPIMMVDRIYSPNAEEAKTGLKIEADNMFCRDGYFMEYGLIEHAAQSAAAFVGYQEYVEKGSGMTPRLGYIGEIKKFEFFRKVRPYEVLTTSLNVLAEAGNVILIASETSSNGEKVAAGRLKLYMEE